ncbi:Zn-dependent exopeptidase [Fusarium albosuccineum]|uniref:Zn-dependent exopeptidase n=1 Tax=Fusarium albosuccineum TaxID=1237068 RepID=A0A8H4L4B9_9HYPO|nr:Zn-dependent exopeptidase [Fusarium albosuccineum]
MELHPNVPYSVLEAVLKEFRPDLAAFGDIYRKLHQDPELSLQESGTASMVTKFLHDLGFDKVLTKIGGHGVVGILRNGAGPKVMLRADMDALPQEEQTGLPYASQKKSKDKNGETVPVMHACGHDLHVTALMAVAKLMHSAKTKWRGTLLCLFQPAEEDGAGARAMVRDGLFDKVPVPDLLLGQHVVGSAPAGTIQVRSGPAQTACDCFDIRIFGKGGHGSRPQECQNPLLAACSIVLRLQGVVTQERAPSEWAVLTCAYLHAGRAINIIPEYVDMKVDLRTYNPDVREKLVSAIKRVVYAECEVSGLDKKPSIMQTDNIPAVVNNEAIVSCLRDVFQHRLGDNVTVQDVGTGSDDFSILGEAKKIPYCYWKFGGTDPERWEEAKKTGNLASIPNNHSPFFGPVIQPTLDTAVDGMGLAALVYLIRDDSPSEQSVS